MLAGLLLAAWLAAPAAPPASADPAVADPLADVELVGLVLGSDDARSAAVLRAADRTRVVSVGESAFGARLASVAAGRVTLEAGGRTTVLRFSPAPRTPPAGPPPAPPEPEAEGRIFTRAEVERRIADETPRILAETALIPVSEDGRVTGFTLSRLPEGSLLTDAGLRPGDVLTEINGTPVDSVATLLALYARLRNETEIRATVLRGGSPVPLVVHLR